MLAKLVDLPTELILQILQNDRIQPMDIYAIGITCKRLNSIAIPLLLEAKGVTDPENSITLSFDYDSLHPSQFYPGLRDPDIVNDLRESVISVEAAVMVAFYISSLREVKCSFPQPFTDVHTLLYHLDRLAGFISRLKSIQSIAFHFTGDNQYRLLDLNPLSANTVHFASVFGEIIQTLTTNGCQTLLLFNSSYRMQEQVELGVHPDEPTSTIALSARKVGRPDPDTLGSAAKESRGVLGISRGKIVNIPAVDSPPSHGPASLMKGTKGVLKRARAKIGSTFSLLHSSKPPSLPAKDANLLYPYFDLSSTDPRGALQAIHIQTPFALLPRCLPAIRNIIHSSSSTLKSLTFSYIVLDEHLFDSCLSSLFLNQPNAITHLSILHCHQISPKSFLQFLEGFQRRLEYLEFDREINFISGAEDLPSRPHFHELHTLKVPLDWVAYFLGGNPSTSKEDEDLILMHHLPNLSTMTIQCRTATTEYFTYQVFRPLLDSILEPLYSRWEACSQYFPNPKIDITLDLKLDRNQPWQMDQDRAVLNILRPYMEPGRRKTSSLYTTLDGESVPSQKQLSTTPTIPIHWQLISKLELSPTHPPDNSIQASVLAQWVTTLFPAVEQVTLPLPNIPRFRPIAEHNRRQRDIVNGAVVFLRKAMRDSRIDVDAAPYAWKTLVVGQWSLPIDLDSDAESSQV